MSITGNANAAEREGGRKRGGGGGGGAVETILGRRGEREGRKEETSCADCARAWPPP